MIVHIRLEYYTTMLLLIKSDDQMTGRGMGTGGEKGTGFVRGARPLLLLACAVALAISVAAGSVYGQDVKLWPDGAPGAKGNDKNDTPTLKMFPPPTDAEGPAPAVLLIPGGGYKHISGYGTFWDFFRTRPVRFFSLKYRLPVHGYRHPAPLQDAQRAVRTIRANAKKWSIDPQRVLVVAFSSGGHVATTLATHYDTGQADAQDLVERFSGRPDYMALFCPVVSMKSHPHRTAVRATVSYCFPLIRRSATERHVRARHTLDRIAFPSHG
ncbi:MAG: alpha/beta hydrolase [Planctomycetes bacterium]|nr:alpha/beta hydrolase [Planctomycetota bacterium]MBL7041390.1 alpha/beta hydrolase [Pirellulaceae bacterium]